MIFHNGEHILVQEYEYDSKAKTLTPRFLQLESAIIIDDVDNNMPNNYSIKIQYKNKFTRSGDKLILYIKRERIQIDKEYYRDIKLKELGIL